MLMGLLLLLVPVAFYIGTFSLSRQMRPKLCILYRVGGGIVTLAGGGFSLYLAAYSGDQGGIAAYFFQLAVMAFYALFAVIVVAANYVMKPPS
ncbi:MAG: hypothetical protein KBT88_12675 [Gammaproteobacteria bacterium]|nr:hypothetical protein [Gammaproteobacteria bacterium]MBQ0840631.1 hypothetical protein [Gammaproteobacteria bacterium]